jgi:hypothetical protein
MNRQTASATAVSLDRRETNDAVNKFFIDNDDSGLPLTPAEVASVMVGKSGFNGLALAGLKEKLRADEQVRSCKHITTAHHERLVAYIDSIWMLKQAPTTSLHNPASSTVVSRRPERSAGTGPVVSIFCRTKCMLSRAEMVHLLTNNSTLMTYTLFYQLILIVYLQQGGSTPFQGDGQAFQPDQLAQQNLVGFRSPKQVCPLSRGNHQCIVIAGKCPSTGRLCRWCQR